MFQRFIDTAKQGANYKRKPSVNKVDLLLAAD